MKKFALLLLVFTLLLSLAACVGGAAGSEAERYAEENGIPFEAIP